MLNEIDLSRVDLNLLVVFETIFAERHVGRAAERLNLSASAVSHGLGRLRRLFNDPVFLRTPKGVVPTARAEELAEPIGTILSGARSVISSAKPFDAATSRRRFTIGAPDGASAVFLGSLLVGLQKAAPGAAISVRQLLPARTEKGPERAWLTTFAALDARELDLAILPVMETPARFFTEKLYDEDFVFAVRACHPLISDPSLDSYCSMDHLIVSLSGDPAGFVDDALAELGRSRRITLTVPNFMFALAIVADTELVAALPRRLVALHGKRFDVAAVEPPLVLGKSQLIVIASKAAMMDRGVVWLMDMLVTSMKAENSCPLDG